MKITRRTLMQWGAALVCGALGFVGIGCRSRRRRALVPSPAPISPDVEAILRAACERLLPSENGPGAREAGVEEYLRRALALPYYRTRREGLVVGAHRLEAVSQRDWKKGFASLEPRPQDQVIAYVQSGAEDDASFEGAAFVQDLLTFTLEGFLCDPVHGGNRGEVGWRFIGYAPDGPRPGACMGDCGK